MQTEMLKQNINYISQVFLSRCCFKIDTIFMMILTKNLEKKKNRWK